VGSVVVEQEEEDSGVDEVDSEVVSEADIVEGDTRLIKLLAQGRWHPVTLFSGKAWSWMTKIGFSLNGGREDLDDAPWTGYLDIVFFYSVVSASYVHYHLSLLHPLISLTIVAFLALPMLYLFLPRLLGVRFGGFLFRGIRGILPVEVLFPLRGWVLLHRLLR